MKALLLLSVLLLIGLVVLYVHNSAVAIDCIPRVHNASYENKTI